MSLADYQAAVTRVCFDAEPRPADLAQLGHESRWLTYRSMVRARIERIMRTALPKSVHQLAATFDTLFAGWLAEESPRSPLYRELPLAFARYLEKRVEEPALKERLRYEATCWRLRSAAVATPEIDELSFEAPIVMNPAMELLAFEHRVHVKGEATADPTHLLVYRAADFRVVTLEMNALGFALVQGWCADDERTLAESVKHTLASLGEESGPRFIDSLGTMLADYLERGVVLGSRPAKG